MSDLTISRKWGVAAKAATSFALLSLIFANGLGFFASSAHAGFIGDLVTVTFTDELSGRSASHSLPNPFAHLPPQAQVPDRVIAMLAERFEMRSHGHTLGYIDALAVDLDGDPVAEIGFTVTAVGADMNVSVVSAVVEFDALSDPAANATAEVHVTDLDNNGAMADVVAPNIGIFRAIYNGTDTYTQLFGDVNVTAGGTGMIDANVVRDIVGDVTSIQSVLNFKLSANDTATGFGRFEVVPEPTTGMLALLGTLGLAGFRRRRRR